MYNKKTSALSVAGIVAGTIVGISAVAAGALVIYKRYFERKIISCCEFGRCNDDCKCECGDDCATECSGECEELAAETAVE